MNASSVRLWKILTLALAAWLLADGPIQADTYAQWAARVFTAQEQSDSTISGENATPAGDGVSNLMKFAFDLNPHQNGVAGLPTVSTVLDYNYDTELQEPYLAITYRAPSGYYPENITCVPEVSPDLRVPSNWMRGQNIIGYFSSQYPQNPGDPYLYTYKVLSPISQNPAGLFMHLRVIEGHTLPADWLQQYFGTTTGINPDDDFDLDGITNWHEYLNGTDPTDYYNAQLPQLFLVGGGNQRAVAGSLLPQPISIEVSYYGDQNAPLTFTATGGALLAPDASGTYNPSATINVRSTGQINVYGYQTYVGQVYVYLPTTTSTISTITATATTAGQSVSVSTTAVASDPNVQPPGGVGVAFNTDTYLSLSFTPSDATLPVSVEVSQDGGVSWSTWGVAAPGATSYTLTGLPQETDLLIRAFTGNDAGGSGGNTNGAQANGGFAPSATSPPTGNISATLYLQPHILGDQVGFSGSNWSYAGFKPPPVNRYLHVHSVITDTDSDNDGDAGTETDDVEVTVNPENRAYTTSGTSVDYTIRTEVIDSDTTKHGTGADDDGDTIDGTHNVTLSEIYPLATFKSDSEGWWPGFSSNFSDGASRAKHDFSAAPGDFGNDFGATFGFDHIHFIEKLQYRWKVNKDPNGHLGFDEVFLPKDGSAIIHHVLNWDTKGATESPTNQPWTIDPLTRNNKAEGTYRVLAVELHAVGQQDGAAGSIVPSIKTDGSGQKHFVVPKNPGGSVSINAVLAGQQEAGMDFDSLYEFVPMGSNATISSTSCQVKTDNPGQYTVQVRTKDSSHTVIARMNVWVVWATGSATNNPTATLAPNTPGIRTVDNNIGNGAYLSLDQQYMFKFSVAPAGIADNTADVPNLTASKDSSGDDQVNGTSPHNGLSLLGGATLRWDVSRRVRVHILNPNLIPLAKMSSGEGNIFQGEPQADLITVPFPGTAVVGNDDTNVADEDNVPYAAGTRSGLTHAIGEVTSRDGPALALADAGGQAGFSFEEDDLFQEFVRLQIDSVWYVVSDPVPWKLVLKISYQNGHWLDNGSTTAPSN